METTQVIDPGFWSEQFMASIWELRKSHEETAQILKETVRIVKENAERQKETDRQMKETAERQKETDRQI